LHYKRYDGKDKAGLTNRTIPSYVADQKRKQASWELDLCCRGSMGRSKRGIFEELEIMKN
jgi:hypothetical protein